MSPFDDSLPEELEPQTRELTALLEHIYQQPTVLTNISDAEQRAILARARARLLNHAEQERTGEQQHVRSSLPSAEPLPLPVRSARARRSGRFLRTFNAIAAVLVAGMLIAGAMLLFTRHASSTGGSASQTKQASASPTGAANSQSDPSSILPCSLVSQAQDAGFAYVCANHLLQRFNIAGKNGQYKVLLTHAYGDRNRVILSLKVEKLVDGKYTPGMADALEVIGMKSSQGLTFPIVGGTGIGTPTDNDNLSFYDVSIVPATISTLQLHVDTEIIPHGIQGVVPPEDITKVALDFSLTLHPEVRIISINQTVNVDGVPMTLKDMRLSLSSVFFDASYKRSAFETWPIVTDLIIGDAHCSDTTRMPDIYQYLDWSRLVAPSIAIAMGCPLLTAHGPAQLVLEMQSGNQPVGVFHFNVPEV